MAVKKRHSAEHEKTVFVAHQLSFANTLAGNDQKIRHKALKKLARYLAARSSGSYTFSEDDLLRVWKGLFYCMWMSDKPLVQEELSENISNLIRCFKSTDVGLLFIKGFFSTMIHEWLGIDAHRMDKFQMFVRRFLRYSFRFCKEREWNLDVVKGLADVFRTTVLSTEGIVKDTSFTIHFCEVFLEELAKVGEGKLQKEVVLELLRPFAENLQKVDDSRLKITITNRVFFDLIRQSSEGVEYEEKFSAWLKAGCPGQSCEDMQFVPDEDDADDGDEDGAGDGGEDGAGDGGEDESGPKVLDPRAGKVNVYIPTINFSPGAIAEMLRGYKSGSLKPKNSKGLKYVAAKFQLMAEGEYPLARKKMFTPEDVKKAGLHREDFTQAIGEHLERIKGEKNKKRKRELDNHADDVGNVTNDSANAEKKRKLHLNSVNGESDANEKKIKKLSKEMKKKEKYMQRRKKREEKMKKKIKVENETNQAEDNNGLENGANLENNIENEPGCSQSSVEDFMNNFSVPEGENASSTPLNTSEDTDSAVVSENNLTVSQKPKIKKILEKRCSPLSNNENVHYSESDIIGKVRRILRSSSQQAKIPSCRYQTTWKVTEVKKDEPQCSVSGCASTSEGAGNENSVTLKQSPRLKRLSLIRSSPSSGRRVNIDLLKNKFQGVSEYEEQVRLSPSIPYDAKKNPCRGVLKPSPFRSPINPFYRPPKGVRIVFS